MKKFTLRRRGELYITGHYLGVQIVSSARLSYERVDIFRGEKPEIINDTDMYIIYTDEDGCIHNEIINEKDQIEFL